MNIEYGAMMEKLFAELSSKLPDEEEEEAKEDEVSNVKISENKRLPEKKFNSSGEN